MPPAMDNHSDTTTAIPAHLSDFDASQPALRRASSFGRATPYGRQRHDLRPGASRAGS